MCCFKRGQIVKCIKAIDPTETPEGSGGCGWELGRTFKVVEITNSTGVPIYWGAPNGGVFEDWLERADEWDSTNNYREE